MTDRYVFAKVQYDPICDDEGCTEPHPFVVIPQHKMADTIPAPDPADWQKVVDAVEQYDTDDEIAREDATSWLLTVTLAAVRNMREAQQ